MKPRERIEAVLNGKQPDLIPFFPKISHAAYSYSSGMTLFQYMTDSECMAEALIQAAVEFGWDAIGITTDIANEGMALGSKYVRSENAVSKLVEYKLESIDQYEQILCPDPWQLEPTGTILRATEIAKKRYGKELYITSWCNGPLNVASQLIHIDEVVIGMMDDPEMLHKLLDRCCSFSEKYAKNLVEAGADAVSFGHAMASNNMISPSFYREFALPYEQRIVAAIHQAGGVAITHICGNISSTIQDIEMNGSEIIDFDHMCDPGLIHQSPKRVFRGNIDPVVLAHESDRQVYDKTVELIKKSKPSGRFILGTGCEVAFGTPVENLKAMSQARLDHG